MPQKPSGGTQAQVYQTPPRPTDSYKKEPPKYEGPPPFVLAQSMQSQQTDIPQPSLSSQNVPLARPVLSFPAFSGLPKALSGGTDENGFREVVKKDATATNTTNRYQTITRITFYEEWSLEELRFADYEKGRKYGPVKASSPISHSSSHKDSPEG